jgi:hypothetical protein
LRAAIRPQAEAADLYAAIGSVPDQAYARLCAAETFVQGGRRIDANAQLAVALPVFARLRANGWQAEAKSLLAASA